MVATTLASGRFTQIDAVGDFKKSALDVATELGKDHTANMLRDYIKCPVSTRTRLREELGGYPEHHAGELFAIVVLLCDGYLSLAPTGASSPLALLDRETKKNK